MLKKTRENIGLLALTLALMMTLAACGTNEQAPVGGNATATPPADATQAAGGTATETAPTPEPAETAELTISAAASLTDALQEIQQAYETANPHITLHFNFGASGALQQQIEQGAPADLFLSAAPKNMQALVDQGLVETERQINLLNNELVVVIPAEGAVPVAELADLTKAEVRTIAVGIPESVPAGSYAKEALTAVGLWEELQSKTVQGKDVRQVLQYVESGNADVGFVYKTDALTADKATIAFTVDPATYPAIEYPIGIVKATKHSEEAEHFYTYLQSQETLDVFVKYGFTASNP